jgi:hypothetical protein
MMGGLIGCRSFVDTKRSETQKPGAQCARLFYRRRSAAMNLAVARVAFA